MEYQGKLTKKCLVGLLVSTKGFLKKLLLKQKSTCSADFIQREFQEKRI